MAEISAGTKEFRKTAMAEIPVLETARLRLRPHRKSDLAANFSMWSDPIVVKHTIGAASTQTQSWMRMITFLGLWELLGYGYWAAEEKSSGQYIGDFGFADFMRGVHPSIAGEPELGWVLTPSAHGKGYATEACLATLAWGDQFLPGHRTVCLISPENIASLRVAEKIGYREIKRATIKELPTVIFERKKS